MTSITLKSQKINIYSDYLSKHFVSGNKYWKLKYNLKEAKRLKKSTLLTFGGAFSNHIHAVAAAGKLFNLKTIGLIRGEIITPLNPTLEFAKANGMELIPMTRQNYRKKNDLDFLNQLQSQFPDAYIIPEGGTNQLAVKGCSEIIEELPNDFDFICCASGTGGTIAGLIIGANNKGKVLGFPALKGNFLTGEITNLIKDYNGNQYSNWELIGDYHFGGYGKHKPPLIDFINNFRKEYDIQLEPLYTGKMMFGIFDMIEKGYFPEGSKIVVIHTGGLQGIAGFNQRFGNILKLS
jgi:1-aminocyclopropane-1-carboxylate deaminase/D-cysteine desulfhydrase-like pyridoxal-dependent ACC family enzyme